MDINIKFSKKARSPNMDKAIELAKDHNYEEKGDIITVTFNEFSKEFDKLWRIISSWISTEIFIDGEEIENSTINNIIYCYHKATCNGNCKHIRLEDWYSIDRLYTDIEDAKRGTYSPERLKLQLERSDFFRKEGEFYFTEINKIKEHILKQIESFKYCEKINTNLILKIIEKLPKKFEVISSQDTEEKREKQRLKEDEERLKKEDEKYEIREKQRLKDFEERLKKEDEIREKIRKEKLKELDKKEFEGFTKYEKGMIVERAKIQAEEIAKELKKLLKK